MLPCGALDHTPIATLDADVALVADELSAAAAVAAAHGVELWTESLHLHRLCWNLERAQLLADRLGDDVGIVMDFSHVVASGGDPVDFVARFGPAHRTRPHPRRRPRQHQPLGRQRPRRLRPRDSRTLATAGYAGHFSLELETRDITDDQRPAAAATAGDVISNLI